jgi:hypothetical protein
MKPYPSARQGVVRRAVESSTLINDHQIAMFRVSFLPALEARVINQVPLLLLKTSYLIDCRVQSSRYDRRPTEKGIKVG